MIDLLVKNARVVFPSGTTDGAVAITAGKVVGVGPEEQWEPAQRTIDAEGKYVLPGLVDPHVHLAVEVGNDRAVDDYYSGTIAAAMGGVTTIIDFAQQKKGDSVLRALDYRLGLAAGQAVIDYGFHAIMTDGRPSSVSDIKRLVSQGVPSLKVFMLYRKEGMIMEDPELLAVLAEGAANGALVSVHAENAAIVEGNVARFVAEGKVAPEYHALSRPNIAEAEAVNRAIYLAGYTGAALYLVHLSTGEAVDMVRTAREAGRPVYGETCTHYLVLTDEMYRREDGYKWIISPPLRKKPDQDRLWEGLQAGWLDVIGSDEGSWDRRIKRYGQAPFNEIPNGGPGVEVRLPVVYSAGVGSGRLSIERLVQVCATNPARIFGLYPKKGILLPGSDADLVILDPDLEQTIAPDRRYRRVDWLATEGLQVRGGVVTTISRGRVIVENGEFLGRAGDGEFLPRRLDPVVLQSPTFLTDRGTGLNKSAGQAEYSKGAD